MADRRLRFSEGESGGLSAHTTFTPLQHHSFFFFFFELSQKKKKKIVLHRVQKSYFLQVGPPFSLS